MRLTTRKTDAFTDTEEEVFTLIASEGTAWFLSKLGTEKREAINTLLRLGHINQTNRRKPAEAPHGSHGYYLTEQGKQALAELMKRKGT